VSPSGRRAGGGDVSEAGVHQDAQQGGRRRLLTPRFGEGVHCTIHSLPRPHWESGGAKHLCDGRQAQNMIHVGSSGLASGSAYSCTPRTVSHSGDGEDRKAWLKQNERPLNVLQNLHDFDEGGL